MRRLLLLAFFLALAGCARQEQTLPGATSSLTESAALAAAGRLTQSFAPPLSFGSVLPTGSMRPALDEHSVVLFEPYRGQPLRVGDIVEYHRDGMRVLHRVIEIRPTGVYTKGDANPLPDKFVRFPEISRRYIGHIVFNPQSITTS